ncbi:MAG: cytochrome c biogenesis protein ResB [Geobacter sp.]|nr:cytochrome c biogenesis protein ResB [Geobacter sp.]
MTGYVLYRKVIRLFNNVKFSACLIALLTLVYFLGLVLPQKRMFPAREAYEKWVDASLLNKCLDWAGFTDIYLSPLTVLLLGLFFINLLVVTLKRFPLILGRMYFSGEKPSFRVAELKASKSATFITTTKEAGELSQQLGRFFSRQRWSLLEGKDANTFLAVKNRLSPAGFLLFHLSFLLCLAGGLSIAYTRFSAKLALTEGQTFEGDIRQFHRIDREPKMFKSLPSLALLLDKVDYSFEKGTPTELVADLQVAYRSDKRREILRINEPINRGPFTLLAQTIGVSPLFIVRDRGGRELDGAYVSLNVLNEREDAFRLAFDRRYLFTVTFFPDYLLRDGKETTRSIQVKNPAFHLRIEREGDKIYEGTIRRGARADAGPFTIGFNDLRFWVEFQLVREYGKSPLILGFVLAAIGLIMRLVFYQKRVKLAIDGANGHSRIYLEGTSEYFPHSFEDEFRTLADKLKQYLEG